MRYAFITPRHLPSMSENKFRADFDFALYLSAAFDKTLKKLFDTSVMTYFCIIIFMMLWMMIVQSLGPIWKVFHFK